MLALESQVQLVTHRLWRSISSYQGHKDTIDELEDEDQQPNDSRMATPSENIEEDAKKYTLERFC